MSETAQRTASGYVALAVVAAFGALAGAAAAFLSGAGGGGGVDTDGLSIAIATCLSMPCCLQYAFIAGGILPSTPYATLHAAISGSELISARQRIAFGTSSAISPVSVSSGGSKPLWPATSGIIRDTSIERIDYCFNFDRPGEEFNLLNFECTLQFDTGKAKRKPYRI